MSFLSSQSSVSPVQSFLIISKIYISKLPNLFLGDFCVDIKLCMWKANLLELSSSYHSTPVARQTFSLFANCFLFFHWLLSCWRKVCRILRVFWWISLILAILVCSLNLTWLACCRSLADIRCGISIKSVWLHWCVYAVDEVCFHFQLILIAFTCSALRSSRKIINSPKVLKESKFLFFVAKVWKIS